MSYELALAAAGATVHDFRSFGSYQGDWWARVTLPDGRAGWINGSYGSCSGCDAFEAEFGWNDECCDAHRYFGKEGCLACAEAKAVYQQRLKTFGEGYLDGVMTQEAAEIAAACNLSWDSDAEQMVAFIKSFAHLWEPKP